jgi:hypothetical protein
MPTFDTGNAQWDQGLGSLANSLFPDPSRIAQAGYLGAQARKTQMEADKMRVERNALRLLPSQHVWGTSPNPPQFSAPGPRLPGVSVPQGLLPNQPQGPMTGMATPGQGQPPAGPPTSMAQAVAPGPAPAPLPVAEREEQIGMPQYQPGSAVKMAKIFTGEPNKLNSGPPPPVSSPGGSAPPAPNATGSDGSVPQNDLNSGPMLPGTLTDPNGGRKYSGPAAPDGSPAPPMDLNGVYTMAYQAGMRGEDLTNYMASAIIEGQQHGVIDHNTATQTLAALNRGYPLQADTQAATQGMVTTEQRGEFLGGTIPIIRDDNTIGAITREMFLKDPTKYRVVDPSTATAIGTQNAAPTNVYKTGPGGEVDPTHVETVTTREAIANRRTRAPADWVAQPEKTSDAPKAYQESGMAQGIAQQVYAVPGRGPNFNDKSRTEPSWLSDQALSVINQRAQDKINQNPTLAKNPNARPDAIREVISDMQKSGELKTPDVIAKERARGWGDTLGELISQGKDPALIETGVGTTPRGFRIDLINPKTGQPVTGTAPLGPQAGGGALSAPNAKLQVPGAQPGAQPQNVQAGNAQPGKPNGAVVISPQGEPMIVQNHVAQKMSPGQRQRYEQKKREQQQQQQQPAAGAP